MASDYLFTSESVTEGHPDKVADQISDAVLDAHLALDPRARVACETLVTTDTVIVAGEITSSASVDLERLARDTIRRIGYDRPGDGFSADTARVQVLVDPQAADIATGVDRGGAGDQGLMFGFACDETSQLMPLPIVLAHGLTRRLAEARRSGELPWLRPDGKAQVTVEYVDREPRRVAAVVVSCHHDREVPNAEIHAAVREAIVARVIPDALLDGRTVYHVNPAGRFEQGGPQADCGLTGRKIIVDTYGGAAPHGGGAFSGKDPSKVDRSAAYMARFLARQVVGRGWAPRCLVQLAYAIGVAEPVSFLVDAEGAGAARNAEIAQALQKEFDLTPAGIIRQLDLLRPIYYPTAAYGHFGRDDLGLPWEQGAGS
jgi:S-adenosylmethionine synthetase